MGNMEETNLVENKVKEAKKKEKKPKTLAVTVAVIAFLLAFFIFGWMLGIMRGYNESKTMADNNKESVEENNNVEKLNPIEDKNVSKTEEKKPESNWKSLGTDISKVEDVYNELYNYIYQFGRSNGGKSFYSSELFSIAANHIKEEELMDKQMDQIGYGYTAKISREKIDATLERYFGNNYQYDYHLKRRNALGIGMLFSILGYDENTKQFEVIYHGADGTSGPSPKIVTRKIEEVFEKDDYVKVVERAIYISSESLANEMYYEIFANPSRSIYIGFRTFNHQGIENQEINVDEFKNEASVITSLYKKGKDGYYFVSSEILDRAF